MKNTLRIIIAAVSSLCICLGLSARGNSRWDDQAAKRKADYIYGEAQRQNALGNEGAVYELYRRAYDIDSTNLDYYTNLAVNYVVMTQRDEPTIHEGIELLRKKFEADPADYVNAYYYSQLLSREPRQRLAVLHTIDSLNPTRTDFALMYVDAIIDSNDSLNVDNALQRLRRLEVTAGKSMELTRRITACYALLDDSVSALNEIRSAIAASPLDAERYAFAGRYFQFSEKPDSALYYLRKATAVEPNNGGAAYELAQFYKSRGDTLSYSREIDRTLMETDLDIEDKHEILLDYTRALFRDSTYYTSVNSIFDRVLLKDPQAVDIRNLYSDFLSYQERYGAAAEQMDLVVDLQPEELNNWVRDAILQSQNNDNEKALATLQRAMKFHEGKPELHKVLAQVLYISDEKGNIDQAINEMKVAFELTDSLDIDTRSELLSSVADFYFAREDVDSAAIFYSRALEINPDNILAKNNFAYHLSESTTEPQQLDKAEKLSFETLIAEPDNPVYIDTYAWILFKKQDYRKAKEYIDRVLNNPDGEKELSSEYYSHAGDIYYFNQLPDEAVEFWKKALLLEPDNELLQRKVEHKTYFHK